MGWHKERDEWFITDVVPRYLASERERNPLFTLSVSAMDELVAKLGVDGHGQLTENYSAKDAVVYYIGGRLDTPLKANRLGRIFQQRPAIVFGDEVLAASAADSFLLDYNLDYKFMDEVEDPANDDGPLQVHVPKAMWDMPDRDPDGTFTTYQQLVNTLSARARDPATQSSPQIAPDVRLDPRQLVVRRGPQKRFNPVAQPQRYSFRSQTQQNRQQRLNASGQPGRFNDFLEVGDGSHIPVDSTQLPTPAHIGRNRQSAIQSLPEHVQREKTRAYNAPPVSARVPYNQHILPDHPTAVPNVPQPLAEAQPVNIQIDPERPSEQLPNYAQHQGSELLLMEPQQSPQQGQTQGQLQGQPQGHLQAQRQGEPSMSYYDSQRMNNVRSTFHEFSDESLPWSDIPNDAQARANEGNTALQTLPEDLASI